MLEVHFLLQIIFRTLKSKRRGEAYRLTATASRRGGCAVSFKVGSQAEPGGVDERLDAAEALVSRGPLDRSQPLQGKCSVVSTDSMLAEDLARLGLGPVQLFCTAHSQQT